MTRLPATPPDGEGQEPTGGHPGDTPTEALTWEGDAGDGGDTGPQAVRSGRTSWTAAELMRVTFEAPRWAVPGVLAEGVNLLAGAPKIGKSWLSLALAVDVATGGRALRAATTGGPETGGIDVHQGDVLYLALEDTGRRLRDRLIKVLGRTPAPDRLTLMTSCPPFPEGAAHITAWLNEHPDARLVVIDVFAMIKGAATSTSAYTADYAAVTRIKKIADEYGVAVLLVHHVRKQASDDFLTEVSGTNGIAGAADAILVLKRTRGTADGALHITGRDVDEAEHALTFEAESGRWAMLPGEAVDHLVGETRARILDFVRAHAGGTPKEIAAGTGLNHENVKKACRRMAEDGHLTNQGGGRYSTVPRVPRVPRPGQSRDQAVPEGVPGPVAVPAGDRAPASGTEVWKGRQQLVDEVFAAFTTAELAGWPQERVRTALDAWETAKKAPRSVERYARAMLDRGDVRALADLLARHAPVPTPVPPRFDPAELHGSSAAPASAAARAAAQAEARAALDATRERRRGAAARAPAPEGAVTGS